MRGVGGIFFDELRMDAERTFGFVRDCADSFLDAYAPIVERRRDERWGEPERQFQLYRRGRYVEFNLIHDRGTSFGLATQGRTESILMSLPPLARWEYCWAPEPGSREEAAALCFQPRDWLRG
jgi:coproporphyrinogen III oxidase